MSDALRVLVVCTGNICRSPMGERVLAAGLAHRFGANADRRAQVRSAGTWGLTGSPMEPFARAALAERGIHDSVFRARRLDEAMIDDADLILGASREHRAFIVQRAPTAMRRTFTIPEAARTFALVGGDAPLIGGESRKAAVALIAEAAAARGRARASRPELDDVDDPYRRPLADFRACLTRLDESLAVVLDALAGPRPDASA